MWGSLQIICCTGGPVVQTSNGVRHLTLLVCVCGSAVRGISLGCRTLADTGTGTGPVRVECRAMGGGVGRPRRTRPGLLADYVVVSLALAIQLEVQGGRSIFRCCCLPARGRSRSMLPTQDRKRPKGEAGAAVCPEHTRLKKASTTTPDHRAGNSIASRNACTQTRPSFRLDVLR